MSTPANPPESDLDVRDELPEDLNAAEFAGAYKFPDNSRRRIPGVMYLVVAAACLVLYLVYGDDGILVNGGTLLAAAVLGAAGVMSLTSGWRMTVDEKEALVKANEAVGFPIGHASAQQVWRGLRSRPTWRVLAYSTENPPKQRAFVLVDAIDGRTIESFSEENPEDLTEWADS
ncbi:MAG: hypothetical protein R2705_23060 [Ilumatobacteraceae bacterium]